MNIVFCSSEVVPFAKTGGLADVCGTLPRALEKLGQRVSVFLPLYKGIDFNKYGIRQLGNGIVSTTLGQNIQVYFVEHDGFFKRDGLYGDSRGDYPDNLERFQFFCKKVLETLKLLNLETDIVHCHDWQTALIPVYLRNLYKNDPFFKKARSILTIHNMAFQGIFPKEKFPLLGLDQGLFSPGALEFYGKINLLKGGIIFSDQVTTVSPNYAREIQTKEFGCGLEDILKAHKDGVVGILNGLDYDFWNPQADSLLPATYGSESVAGKTVNKTQLQRTCYLPELPKTPILGFVGRLSHQKGIDLILETIPRFVALDIQLVILGVGDQAYHHRLTEMAKRFKSKMAVLLEFNEARAHLVYAGSDIFLMPSTYEPCGLSQMISLFYGTIPIVYKTGGLADTIQPYNQGGNGFVFSRYHADEFVRTIEEAVSLYHDEIRFGGIVRKAFETHFSWEDSARQYIGLYSKSRFE